MGGELSTNTTGLIRRGEDELVVAELTMTVVSQAMPELKAAELYLFRSGEWVVKHPRIRHNDRDYSELPLWSLIDSVITIGDRQLCWVNLAEGLLFLDVFDERPVLQYVKLPADPCYGEPLTCRNVCVTAGGGAIKFVNILPRCCCGGLGVTNCQHSLGACIVNTWTLWMSDMEWVKDGMVDVTELWALDAYNGLPRLPLAHPVVSMDESHVICFLIVEADDEGYGGQILCKLMVNMRSKTIRSVSYYPSELWDSCSYLIPSNVSYYFNNMSYSKGKSDVDTEISPVQVSDDDAGNVVLRSSCKSSEESAVQASDILTALQEILDHDDMLKAVYRTLCHGNGRRFGTLLSLPPNLRKEWLLMEMKACED